MALLDYTLRLGKILEMRLLGTGIDVDNANIAYVLVKFLTESHCHRVPHREEEQLANVFRTCHVRMICENDGYSFIYSIPFEKDGEMSDLRDSVAYLRALKRKVRTALTSV